MPDHEKKTPAAHRDGEALYQAALEHRANKRYDEAAAHFRAAADLGHAPAMYELSMCYALGQGVVRDKAADFAWTLRAAQCGLVAAIGAVGFLYELGVGVEEDCVQAAAWYRRAAELGDAESMYSLALCYANGTGVEADLAQYRHWVGRAAELGCPSAMDCENYYQTRYLWVTRARNPRARAVQGWRIVVDACRRKEDHVYADVEEETWRETHDLRIGLTMTHSSVSAEVSALLFDGSAFAGVALTVREPAGGLSLVVDEATEILLPGRPVSAGYHVGHDDYSVSYNCTFTLEQGAD